jgi:hypothetical protein
MYTDDDQSYLQQLPRIGATHTSIAALMNQSRTDTVAFPRGMPLGGIVHKANIKIMISKHAQTVQDAYAACHGLTVLTSEKHRVKHLIDAENCELEHASLGTKPLDDSLPARPVSVVGLVTGPVCRHQGAYSFLNAMAHLASAPSNTMGSSHELASLVAEAEESNEAKDSTANTSSQLSAPPLPPAPSMSTSASSQSLLAGHQSVPVAQHARMAFLVGNDACEYINSRTPSIAGSTSEIRTYMRDPCSLVVAISWALKEGPAVTLHTRLVPLSMPTSNTADSYYDALVSTLAKFSEDSGVLLPGAVFATRDSCQETSYVNSVKKITDAYQDIVCPDVSIRLSSYLRSSQCRNPLAVSMTKSLQFFVRTMPQRDSGGITSPKCSHGILVHERDREVEVRDFIQSVALEERQRGANVYGLRPPSPTIAEESLGIHVVDMSAEGFSMGRLVTLYGLMGVPGMRLSVNDGSHVWRIVRRLHQLDAEYVKHAFVLPCTKESCEPEQFCMRLPSFELIEKTIEATVQCFERLSEGAPGHMGGGTPLEKVLSMDRFEIERPYDTPAGPIDPDVAFFNTAIGLGLNCPACRVGDVYDEAQRRGAPSSLLSMLVAAIARSGPDESVTVAVEAIGKQAGQFQSKAEGLQKDVDRLTHELQIFKSAVESEQRHQPAQGNNSGASMTRVASTGHTADETSDEEQTGTRPSITVPRISRPSTPTGGYGGQVEPLSPTGVGRLAAALGLKMASQGITVAHDAELPIDKMLTVVAKSCGCKKADLPAASVQEARAIVSSMPATATSAGTTPQDKHQQVIQRVSSCVGPIARAIETPLFLLTPCEQLVRAIDLRTGRDSSAISIMNESRSPKLMVLRDTGMLSFYESV